MSPFDCSLVASVLPRASAFTALATLSIGSSSLHMDQVMFPGVRDNCTLVGGGLVYPS
ncbi:hypothetical protein PR003_g7200 [Phytophthora rubi]|uniref:Uncharacterized protein n=1 Tax=Phytophthora rubi TaxID=129364 RepID=A0A6A3N598_9STRA|nr:hypothetical protein PR002_g7072 [Phytophthora rubi]KAE9041209.1 hypothetical protein PR001_g6718 [Phytophthora rubi]KAE9346915.1 hypothetical protein PR003_g7200 [Phytophthora rubi]